MNTCGEEKQVQAGGDLRGGQTPTQKFAQPSNSPFICTAPHSTGPSTPVLHSSGFGFTLARPGGRAVGCAGAYFPLPPFTTNTTVTGASYPACLNGLIRQVASQPPAPRSHLPGGSQRRSKSRSNGTKKGTAKKRAEERGRRKGPKKGAEETSSRTSTT